MIPQILERLILEGKAVYSVHTHAWSMFGSIPIPKNKLVIIIGIKWNYFMNPYQNSDAANSVKNTLKFNEYQLKIESAKSKSFFHYRNGVVTDNIGVANPSFTWTQALASRTNPFVLLPPDQKEVYLVCNDYIKLTISRNCFVNVLTPTTGAVSNLAGESAPPNGVAGINLLTRMQEASATPNTMYNTPAGNDMAGLTSPGQRNTQSYTQDIDASNSLIYAPGQGGAIDIINMPFFTNPLVELALVTVNTNEYNNLINS